MRRKNLGSSIVKRIITVAMAFMMMTSTVMSSTVKASAEEVEQSQVIVTEIPAQELEAPVINITAEDVLAAMNQAEKSESEVVKSVWVGDVVAEEIIAIYEEQKAEKDVVDSAVIEAVADKVTDAILDDVNDKIEGAEGDLIDAKDYIEPTPDEDDENLDTDSTDNENEVEVEEVDPGFTRPESGLDNAQLEIEGAIEHANDALEAGFETSADAMDEYNALESAYNTANDEYKAATDELSEAYQKLAAAQVEYEKAKDISDIAAQAALNQLKKAEAEMDIAVAATKEAKDRVDATYNALVKVSGAIDDMQDATEDALAEVVGKLEESMQNTKDAIANLEGALGDAEQPILEFEDAAGKLKTAIENLMGHEGAIADAVSAQAKLDYLYTEYKFALYNYNKALDAVKAIDGEVDETYLADVESGKAVELIDTMNAQIEDLEAVVATAEQFIKECNDAKQCEAKQQYREDLKAAQEALAKAESSDDAKAAQDKLAELIIRNEIAIREVSTKEVVIGDERYQEVVETSKDYTVHTIEAGVKSEYGYSETDTFYVVTDSENNIVKTYMYQMNDDGALEIYETTSVTTNKVELDGEEYTLTGEGTALDANGEVAFKYEKDAADNYFKVVDVDSDKNTVVNSVNVNYDNVSMDDSVLQDHLKAALGVGSVLDGNITNPITERGCDYVGEKLYFEVKAVGDLTHLLHGVNSKKDITYRIYVSIDEDGNATYDSVVVSYYGSHKETHKGWFDTTYETNEWDKEPTTVELNIGGTVSVKSTTEVITATINGNTVDVTEKNGQYVAVVDNEEVVLVKDANGFHIKTEVEFIPGSLEDTVYSLNVNAKTDKTNTSFEEFIKIVEELYGTQGQELAEMIAERDDAQAKLDAYNAYIEAKDKFEEVDLGTLEYLPKHIPDLFKLFNLNIKSGEDIKQISGNVGTIITGIKDENGDSVDYSKIKDLDYLVKNGDLVAKDINARLEAFGELNKVLGIKVDPKEFISAYLAAYIEDAMAEIEKTEAEAKADADAAWQATKSGNFILAAQLGASSAAKYAQAETSRLALAGLNFIKGETTDAKTEYVKAWINAIDTKIKVAEATIEVGKEAINTGKAGVEVMKAAAKINDAAVKVALAKAQEDLMYGAVTALVVAGDTLDLAEVVVNAILNEVAGLQDKTDKAYEDALEARKALEALMRSTEPVNEDRINEAKDALDAAWANYEALASQLGVYTDAEGNVLTDKNGKPVVPQIEADEDGNIFVAPITVDGVEYTVDNGLYQDLEDARALLEELQSEYDRIKAIEDAYVPVVPTTGGDEGEDEDEAPAVIPPVVPVAVVPVIAPANAVAPAPVAVAEVEEVVAPEEVAAPEEVVITEEETPLVAEPEVVTVPEEEAPLAPAPEAVKKNVWWWWILVVIAAATAGVTSYVSNKKKKAAAATVEAEKANADK